jgi:hypothetical protein
MMKHFIRVYTRDGGEIVIPTDSQFGASEARHILSDGLEHTGDNGVTFYPPRMIRKVLLFKRDSV